MATWNGFVYVATRQMLRICADMIDAFARRIVGWRALRTAHAGFVLDALKQALHQRRPFADGGLVHHSDRGSHHLALRYTERLAEAGIEPSVATRATRLASPLATATITLLPKR